MDPKGKEDPMFMERPRTNYRETKRLSSIAARHSFGYVHDEKRNQPSGTSHQRCGAIENVELEVAKLEKARPSYNNSPAVLRCLIRYGREVVRRIQEMANAEAENIDINPGFPAGIQ